MGLDNDDRRNGVTVFMTKQKENSQDDEISKLDTVEALRLKHEVVSNTLNHTYTCALTLTIAMIGIVVSKISDKEFGSYLFVGLIGILLIWVIGFGKVESYNEELFNIRKKINRVAKKK